MEDVYSPDDTTNVPERVIERRNDTALTRVRLKRNMSHSLSRNSLTISDARRGPEHKVPATPNPIKNRPLI